MLEEGSRQWDEARKYPLVIQSVLQLLKHRRECINSREGIVRKGINKSGINRRCTVRKDIDRSAIDRKGIDRKGIDRRGIVKEGIDSSAIDGGADDVRDNHRPQHSSVTGKLLSVSTLHIILCAKSAEDSTETTMYQHFTCHLQYSPDSGRGYMSEATK